jgi:hypothetical protein
VTHLKRTVIDRNWHCAESENLKGVRQSSGVYLYGFCSEAIYVNSITSRSSNLG